MDNIIFYILLAAICMKLEVENRALNHGEKLNDSSAINNITLN